MKLTPELAEKFYRTYGFPLEITTTEELRLLQESDTNLGQDVAAVDDFNPIGPVTACARLSAAASPGKLIPFHRTKT